MRIANRFLLRNFSSSAVAGVVAQFYAENYDENQNVILDDLGNELLYDVFSYTTWEYVPSVVPAKVTTYNSKKYAMFNPDSNDYRRINYTNSGVFDLSGDFTFEVFHHPGIYSEYSIGSFGLLYDNPLFYDSSSIRFLNTSFLKPSGLTDLPYAYFSISRTSNVLKIGINGVSLYQDNDTTDYSSILCVGSCANGSSSYTQPTADSRLHAYRLTVGLGRDVESIPSLPWVD